MRRIAFVGNDPDQADRRETIDAADHVVRFNNAHGFGSTTGQRVDELYLVNCGGQMDEWLSAPEFLQTGPAATAPLITLPIAEEVASLFPPSAGAPDPDGVNHAARARAILMQAGKRVETVSLQRYREAARSLGQTQFGAGRPVPSTGFIAIHRTASLLHDPIAIDLYGFTFAGWDGHDWRSERRWVERMERLGRVAWHRG